MTHGQARRYLGTLDPAIGTDPSRPMSAVGEGALRMASLNREPARAVRSDAPQLASQP